MPEKIPKSLWFAVLTLTVCLSATPPLLSGCGYADEKPLTAAQKQFDENVRSPYIPKDSVTHRLFNFHRVTPGIWRSSQPNRDALDVMKKFGLKTIINLRTSQSSIAEGEKNALDLGLNYYSFPMSAWNRQKDERLRRILAVITDPENQPVLIHCHAGKDRTGLMMALYKLAYTNAPFEDIYNELLMYGFDTRFKSITETILDWKKKYRK